MLMKKIRLIELLFIFCHTLKSQETLIENKYILGGSINFQVQNNTYPLSILSLNSGIGGIYTNGVSDSKNTSYSISPYIGKEISPGLIIGVHLDYQIGKYKSDVTEFGQPNFINYKRNSSEIGFGLFTRHILNPGQQFNLFIQPYIDYHLLNEEVLQDSELTQEQKASYFKLGAGAGLLYNINKKIRANLRIGGINYINGKWEILNTTTKKDFSSFGTNINLSSLYFGFELRL